MKTIGDILSRDLSKKIVEVIQVDQDKDEDLYSEITEYIATDSIKEQYATLLKAIAEAPADPHDNRCARPQAPVTLEPRRAPRHRIGQLTVKSAGSLTG